MYSHSSTFVVWVTLASLALAHQVGWHEAMYAKYGVTPGVEDPNNNAATHPLWQLPQDKWFMHAVDGTPNFPPKDGVFMELQAGQSITLEIADNLASSSLGVDPTRITDWGDAKDHPDDYDNPNCITQPNLHCYNQSTAAGTSLAISYESDISKVTMDNLVVFTVRYNTPWKRLVTYDIPAGMPACPDDGCTCTFNWVPCRCGEPNFYMYPYRCKIIPDSTPPKIIGTPKPPICCGGNTQKGPKQIVVINQLEGNTAEVTDSCCPGYNEICGFPDGAQNDIFVTSGGSGDSAASTSAPLPSTSNLPSSTPSSSPTSDSHPENTSSSVTPTLPVSSPAVPPTNPPGGQGPPSTSDAHSPPLPSSSDGSCKGHHHKGAGGHSKRARSRRGHAL